MRTRLLVFVLVAALAAPGRADAWGFVAHALIMERAIALLPAELRPLFEKHRAKVVERIIDPDTWRAAGFAEEEPNHFLDLDWEGYGKEPFRELPRDYTAAVAKFGRARILANGTVPWLSWADHPVYLAALVLAAPIIHEVHFFCIHRLIHVPILYKWIHSVHHNSINATPWSSLSMHPVESLLYHAVALWHLVIPSNPIVGLFQLHLAGFGALNGHIGFDRLEITKGVTLDSYAYAHYLHHKYFEVNYGGDGLIPLDLWFGTWHDGSKEAEARMNERFKRKRDRLNSKPAAGAA